MNKNRRQQIGEKDSFFLSFIELCLGKEKGFGIQARKNKLQKVLVVNLTPAVLTADGDSIHPNKRKISNVSRDRGNKKATCERRKICPRTICIG